MKRVVCTPGKVNPPRGIGVVDRLSVNDELEEKGQYFGMSFLRFDNFATLMEPDDWKGKEAGFELASQSLPPLLTLYFPVGTLLKVFHACWCDGGCIQRDDDKDKDPACSLARRVYIGRWKHSCQHRCDRRMTTTPQIVHMNKCLSFFVVQTTTI